MKWPEDMAPQRSPVYARNEIVIPAEPERVWSWLVHAKQWPEWYANCDWVHLSTEELEPTSEFAWKTFGVALHSRVIVFEPGVAIEWDARGPAGIRAYHGWRIDYDGHESHVVTEETQAGLPISLGRWFLRGRLLRGHQIWVESLKKVAMSEQPAWNASL
jgi:hypothetical protein